MKNISSELQAHIAEDVTSLTTLWRIIRTDGVEFFFTQLDIDLDFEGDTYVSAFGYNPSDVHNRAGMQVDTVEVTGFLDSSALTDQDLRAGKFSYAEVRMSIVNWKDLTMGELKVRRGRLGEVTYSEDGVFFADLRGMMDLFNQEGYLEVAQPTCRVTVGSPECKVPVDPPVVVINTAYAVGDYVKVATTGGTGQEVYENRIYECTTAGTTAGTPPTYDTVIDNTTVDGTATFTARDAFTRHAVVATVVSQKEFTITVTESRAVDDWFKHGGLEWETGNNAGKVMEVKTWAQSTTTITFFEDTPFVIQVGDKLNLYAGCDREAQTCKDKFVIPGSTDFANGNKINFRGQDQLPGPDFVFSVPDLN